MKIIISILSALSYGVLGQTYRAAVVEYVPIRKAENLPKAIIFDNVEEIKRITQNLRPNNVDVVVFPEFSLTTLEAMDKIADHLESYSLRVPEVNSSLSLCNIKTIDRLISIMACAASDEHKYLVINLIELDGEKTFYSTTVVFDRQGRLIAKYRKINLSNEVDISSGTEPVRFTTDFNITFGLLTSDDILSKQPTRKLLEWNIKDVIVTMAWSSSIPFLHVQSIQEGYAISNGVNLLAANLNMASDHIGGSGIYLCDQRNELTLTTRTRDNVTIGDIPISSRCGIRERDTMKTKITRSSLHYTPKLEKLMDYKFENLSQQRTEISTKLCTEDMMACCMFVINLKQNLVSDTYRLSIFRGVQDLGYKTTLGINNCGLIFYPPEINAKDVEAAKNVEFNKISITAVYPNSGDAHYQPSAVTFAKLSPVYTYHEIDKGEHMEIVMETVEPVSSLMTYGIFGRLYTCDGDKTGRVCSNALLHCSNVLLSVFCVFLIKTLNNCL